MIVLPPHEPSELTTRLGRIDVSREFLMDHPLSVVQTFALLEFIPYEIVNYRPNVLTYWGISPRFDSVEVGKMPPLYLIQVEERGRDVVNVNIKRETSDDV